jgi:Papain fold toxin 1, glutamine deamidase
VDPFDFNCAHCVQAYELRRRGMEVEATGLPDELMPSEASLGGRQLADVQQAWGVEFTVAAPIEIAKAFKAYGPGSRGFVAVLWYFGGGHLFSVYNVGGHIRFVDPQTGAADVSHYFELARWRAYARVDDAEPGSMVLDYAVRS